MNAKTLFHSQTLLLVEAKVVSVSVIRTPEACKDHFKIIPKSITSHLTHYLSRKLTVGLMGDLIKSNNP